MSQGGIVGEVYGDRITGIPKHFKGLLQSILDAPYALLSFVKLEHSQSRGAIWLCNFLFVYT